MIITTIGLQYSGYFISRQKKPPQKFHVGGRKVHWSLFSEIGHLRHLTQRCATMGSMGPGDQGGIFQVANVAGDFKGIPLKKGAGFFFGFLS